MLHDGFATKSIDVGPLQLPPRAPSVAIVQPQQTSVRADQKLYLLGDGASYGAKALEDASFSWALDGKVVAASAEAWLDPLDVGPHQLSLTVTDGERSTVERMEIDVTPP